MLVMLISEPFQPEQYVMRVDFTFDGLPNLVVSGNSFVQLPFFDGQKMHNLKKLEVKKSQRLKFILFRGKKYSHKKLDKIKIKTQKVIEIPCPI